MAVKKNTAKAKQPSQSKLFTFNSTSDDELQYPTDNMDTIIDDLDSWNWYDGEIVTIYELIPVKKFKRGGVQEVK